MTLPYCSLQGTLQQHFQKQVVGYPTATFQKVGCRVPYNNILKVVCRMLHKLHYFECSVAVVQVTCRVPHVWSKYWYWYRKKPKVSVLETLENDPFVHCSRGLQYQYQYLHLGLGNTYTYSDTRYFNNRYQYQYRYFVKVFRKSKGFSLI